MNNKITFNNSVKLIISDVDETIADLYKPADPQTISELTQLLRERKMIFL